MEPINTNWTNNDIPDGGISTGIGFTIAWQRGSLENGRNGAFLIEVLESCFGRLADYQEGKFACKENMDAIAHLGMAIQSLKSRRDRRASEGVLGTHEPDQTVTKLS